MNHPTKGWIPIVSEADVAVSVALEVAGRLKSRELVKRACLASVEHGALPDVRQWRHHSLQQGSSGLALLFGHLDRCFPGDGWDQEARWHLEKAARSLENSDQHIGI